MMSYPLHRLVEDPQRCRLPYEVMVGKVYVTYPDDTFYDEEGRVMNTAWFGWKDVKEGKE